MNCYITSPKKNAEYPSEINKDNTMFYPEQSMTTLQCFTTARPRDYHIITDSPFLVGLYDKREVFIWKDGNWINPEFQTYGASFMVIIDELFDYESSINAAVIDKKLVTNCMGKNAR